MALTSSAPAIESSTVAPTQVQTTSARTSSVPIIASGTASTTQMQTTPIMALSAASTTQMHATAALTSTAPIMASSIPSMPTTAIPTTPEGSAPSPVVSAWSKSFGQLGVTLKLEQDNIGVSTMRLSGPSDVWFGVGLHAQTMAEEPHAVLVDCVSERFEERRLSQASLGQLLEPSLEMTAPPEQNNGVCSVVLRQSPMLATSPHALFDPLSIELNVIVAVGRSDSFFSGHEARVAGHMDLDPL